MQLVCTQCNATNRVPNERINDQPVCGRCGHELISARPVELSEQQLSKFLTQTELPIVIDFWAPWCGPCRTMAPQFELAAQQMSEVLFVKVNSDEAPSASQQWHIRSIPSLVLFHQGHEIARHSGAIPAQQIISWLRANLKK